MDAHRYGISLGEFNSVSPELDTELSEDQTNVSEHFLEIPEDYQRIPKITKDF